ncbi:MAG TPA: hypothetical protein VFQ44_21745 [Streptosporangiaceae bacterium]|nr:hypothetical protein [Streptosporangiaceae bacterium]
MRVSLSVTGWLITGVLAAGAAGAALALAGSSSPARVPLVLIFLAAAPAFAFASLLRGFDRLATVVISGTAAMVINFGVAEAMAGTGSWSLRAGVIAVGLISVVIAAVAARLTGAGRRRPGHRYGPPPLYGSQDT